MTETPNPHIDPDTLTGEMRPIRPAVLSLGSNAGDRLANLQGAINAFADTPDVNIVAVSSVYETTPVDAPDGSPEFLNAVLLADTHVVGQRAPRPGDGRRGRLRPRAHRAERSADPRHRPDRRRRPALRHRRAQAAAPAGAPAGLRPRAVARDRPARAAAGPGQDRRPARQTSTPAGSCTDPISSSRSSSWLTSRARSRARSGRPASAPWLLSSWSAGVLGLCVRAASRSPSATAYAPQIQWIVGHRPAGRCGHRPGAGQLDVPHAASRAATDGQPSGGALPAAREGERAGRCDRRGRLSRLRRATSSTSWTSPFRRPG